MTVSLDAHAKPPESVRALYKKYLKATLEFVLEQPDLIHFGHKANEGNARSTVRLSQAVQLPTNLREICQAFLEPTSVDARYSKDEPEYHMYEVPAVPGKTATQICSHSF